MASLSGILLASFDRPLTLMARFIQWLVKLDAPNTTAVCRPRERALLERDALRHTLGAN